MPIYIYYCPKCNEKFEQERPADAPPPEKCPVCGAKDIRRVFEIAGVVYKGKGFYTTDQK